MSRTGGLVHYINKLEKEIKKNIIIYAKINKHLSRYTVTVKLNSCLYHRKVHDDLF